MCPLRQTRRQQTERCCCCRSCGWGWSFASSSLSNGGTEVVIPVENGDWYRSACTSSCATTAEVRCITGGGHNGRPSNPLESVSSWRFSANIRISKSRQNQPMNSLLRPRPRRCSSSSALRLAAPKGHPTCQRFRSMSWNWMHTSSQPQSFTDRGHI